MSRDKYLFKILCNMTKGFTLIEMMTAVSIFLVVMTMSMGSILGVFDANRKSQALRIVMNNLNLAVESMAREIRFGTNYHCGADGALSEPQNCVNGDNLISFLSSDNEQIAYRLAGTTIEKSTDGGISYIAVTAPEIIINDLTFYVLGAGKTNAIQAKALIKIKGTAGKKESSRTSFGIQTLVSQRLSDI